MPDLDARDKLGYQALDYARPFRPDPEALSFDDVMRCTRPPQIKTMREAKRDRELRDAESGRDYNLTIATTLDASHENFHQLVDWWF